MPKILSFSFGYPSPAHPGRFVFTQEQARALKQLGAEVEIVDLAANPDNYPEYRKETYREIVVHRFPLPRALRKHPLEGAARWTSALAKLKALLKEAPDLVLLSFINHKYLPLLPLLKNSGAKIALVAHGVDAMAHWEARWLKKAKQAVLRQVDAVFAVSHETASLCKSLLPADQISKVEVILNGVDRAKLDQVKTISAKEARNRLELSEEKALILTVCNLVPRKGVDLLLQADAELKKAGIDFQHLIVGRGPQAQRLEELRQSLGLEQQVTFEPRILSDEELALNYAACDLFALASRTLYQPPAMEGFGVVYAEAGYLGKPVVAGRSGGVPSVIVPEQTRYLIDPEAKDAPQLFAEALRQLIVDSSLREEMGRKAEAHAQQYFDWKLHAARILKAIR